MENIVNWIVVKNVLKITKAGSWRPWQSTVHSPHLPWANCQRVYQYQMLSLWQGTASYFCMYQGSGTVRMTLINHNEVTCTTHTSNPGRSIHSQTFYRLIGSLPLMFSRQKNSNIGHYRNKSPIFRDLSRLFRTGSKYIAIKDELLQIIECPRLWKNNVPEVTDLLRYCSMLKLFGGESNQAVLTWFLSMYANIFNTLPEIFTSLIQTQLFLSLHTSSERKSNFEKYFTSII